MYKRMKIMEHEDFLVYILKNEHEEDEQLYYALYENSKEDKKKYYLIRTFRIYKFITLHKDLLKSELDNYEAIEKVIQSTENYVYMMLRDFFSQQYAEEIWDNLCKLDLHKQAIEEITEEELYYVEIQ